MRVSNVINEGSSGELVVDFTDPAGLPSVPSSVVYRIDCTTTGQAIRASTPIAPSSSITIPITVLDTNIVAEANASERRRVTVTASYGAGESLTGEYDYVVRNLRYA